MHMVRQHGQTRGPDRRRTSAGVTARHPRLTAPRGMAVRGAMKQSSLVRARLGLRLRLRLRIGSESPEQRCGRVAPAVQP